MARSEKKTYLGTIPGKPGRETSRFRTTAELQRSKNSTANKFSRLPPPQIQKTRRPRGLHRKTTIPFLEQEASEKNTIPSLAG
jgi:hypothetical protein